MSQLTHMNHQGNAKMVDVSDKNETHREAIAESSVSMNEVAYQAIKQGKVKKGDVLAVAQVAGVMAAKNTSQIIPMCHPLSLTGIDIHFDWNDGERKITITAMVKTKGQTGVEMEALTAASACALTIYDMCKALDKGIVIGPTFLKSKTGGKSGDYERGSS